MNQRETINFGGRQALYQPSPDSEEHIVIPMPDFHEVKELSGQLLDPIISPATWAATAFGISVGCAASWLTMDQPDTTQGIALLIGAGAFLVLALFMAYVAWMIPKRYSEPNRRHLVRTLDRLEKNCKRLKPHRESDDPPAS